MKTKTSRITALVLAFLLCLPTVAWAAGTASTATPSSARVLVDGKYVSFEGYTIDSEYYFKLRDIAYTLKGTAKQFDVSWNGTGNTISLQSNKAYIAVGGEMQSKGAGPRAPVTSSSKILVDGKEAAFAAYTIQGNNYVALRDLGKAFNFGITWNGSTSTYGINTASAYKEENLEVLEVNVTDMPNFHSGNPSIAVNPKDNDNLVYVATCTTPWNAGSHFAMEQVVYYSNNGGQTWNLTDFPFGIYPGAGVATVAVDPDGTFYLHYNALRAPDPKDDAIATRVNPTMVSRSTDGGRTWSGPVTTPFKTASMPRSRIDMATGKYYIVAAMDFQFPVALSVSTDKGETFSDPVRFPRPLREVDSGMGIYVGYPGNNFGVHGGILATAYQESQKDPNVDDVVRFLVTRDDGKTWEDLPVEVKDANGVLQPVRAGNTLIPTTTAGPYGYSDPYPWVTADPSKVGRFAVMVPRGGSHNNLIRLCVYITEDAGKTWTGPAEIIAIDATRPWIEFGPTGELGVMWRTHAVDAYAVLSTDHGATFSRPVQLNSKTQPLGDSGPMSDHWSWITVDKGYVNVGWADCRSGGALDAIFARVPFSMFEPLPATPYPTTTYPGKPLPFAPES